MALTVAAVETAIEKVLKNQSYRLDGVTYTRANLKDLWALRKELKAEDASDDQDIYTLAKFDATS